MAGRLINSHCLVVGFHVLFTRAPSIILVPPIKVTPCPTCGHAFGAGLPCCIVTSWSRMEDSNLRGFYPPHYRCGAVASEPILRKVWLPSMDSNHHIQLQRLASYH